MRLRKALGVAFLATAASGLIVYLALAASGPFAFRVAATNSTNIGNLRFLPLFVLGPLPLPIPLPVPVSISVIFLALVVLYLGLLVYTVFDGTTDFIQALNSFAEGRLTKAMGNSFVSVLSVTSATILVVLAITVFQEGVGVPTGEVTFSDRVTRYFFISYAPLTEEVGFRVSLIGLGLLLAAKDALRDVGLDLTWRKSLSILLHPGRARRHFESTFDRDFLSSWTWVLVVVAGVVFGLSHSFVGSGWDIGKASTASLAGVSIGYLYVQHGFPAAVISHWVFNYATETVTLLQNQVALLGWAFDLTIIAAGSLTVLYLLVKAVPSRGAGGIDVDLDPETQ